jgi:glycosyltransferase 2 family protein
LLLGVLFLGLAVRRTEVAEVRNVLAGINPRWVVIGLCCYVLGLGLRSLRWGILVRRLLNVKYALVGEALLVGYAVNNILPARLGELFRADYMSRLADVSRPAVFGTIVIERLLDATILASGLGIGLLSLETRTGWATTGSRRAGLVLGIVTALLAALGIATVAIRPLREPIAQQKNRLANIARNFAVGLRSIDASNLGISIGLSILIWIAEGGAMWFVGRSVGAILSPAQSMVLLGLASFSTLLPTAPGYIGSYQLAFAISFSLFGASQAIGIAASTITQAAFFGFVTICGLSAYLGRMAQRMLAKPEG